MKKFIAKIGVETFLGAIFASVAIAATIVEMYANGFSMGAIAGGIKDIFSTIITVAMFVVAVGALRPKSKRGSGFQATFDNCMDSIVKKYEPMVQNRVTESSKKYGEMYLYQIASRLDCVSTSLAGKYNKFFRLKEGLEEIEFSVTKTVFGDRYREVSERIGNKILKSHSDFIDNCITNDNGFILYFKNPLRTPEDAKALAGVVDHILLLYVAEEKK